MSDSICTDPLGRDIELSDATWYGHLVRNHREMTRLRAEVDRTVASPVEIRFSASDPDCRLYYGPSPRAGFMICVVVDVVGKFVKTAYLAKRVKQGAVEWP